MQTKKLPDNPERALDSMFWRLPLVQIPTALEVPFFTKQPLPHFIGTRSMDYFVSGLMELSQLVHEVAINTPIRGYRVNHILHNFLIFHIQNFLDVSFRDATFMTHLRPQDPKDEEAVQYLKLLRVSGEDFLRRWEAALGPLDRFADPVVMKEYWVAVKKTADVISVQTVALHGVKKRIMLKLPLLCMVDAYVTEGALPDWLTVIWLLWGVAVGLYINIMIWIMWRSPTLWNAILSTVVCTTGFAGFLIFFYTLTRRNAHAAWCAEVLSANLTREYYLSSPRRAGGQSTPRDRDVEFLVRPKGDAVMRVLTIKPLVFNRQVVMIGVTDVRSLRICSWNLRARIATEITWEQAIGKPLQALMDPRSVAAVRSLFNEIKQNPRQQRRLLFNSVSKGTVVINASATIAHVDGVPVGMIVGTVLEEEERDMMSYFSRTGVCALLNRLSAHNINDSVTANLALANSWDALKNRTTQAIRNWSCSTLEELIDPLNAAVEAQVAVLQCDSEVPAKFQCDVAFIRNLFQKIVRVGSQGQLGSTLSIDLSCVQDETHQCHLLRILVEAPDMLLIEDSQMQDLQDVVNNVGYLVKFTKRHLEVLVPISPSIITGSRNIESTEQAHQWLVCTFIIFEPDPVYVAHLSALCRIQQHRFCVVDSIDGLASKLDDTVNDVSAVIISACDERFNAMVQLCRQRNVFVVATKVPSDVQPLVISFSYDGPFYSSPDIGYVLNKPVQENSWMAFLEYLSVMIRNHRAIQSSIAHDYRKVRQIGSGANSRVDLVREVVTGGLMARKTVYISMERPLSALATEVEIMKRLSGHPCIVRHINSYSPNQVQFCMFLQYCKDGSLRHYVQRQPQRRLTLSQLALFTSDLVSAVNYAHSNGVAHRDIKPENILLCDEMHLKLADFGSATMDHTIAGRMMGGTLQFMAPERLADIDTFKWEQADMDRLYAEDVWSIGLTLLDLMNAYPPQLQGLSDVGAFMQTYVNLRDNKEELTFTLPTAGASEESVAQATDFIQRTILLHPSVRASTEQLMQHPFIASVDCDRERIENPLFPTVSVAFASTNSHIGNLDYVRNSSFFTADDDTDTDEDDGCRGAHSGSAFLSIVF